MLVFYIQIIYEIFCFMPDVNIYKDHYLLTKNYIFKSLLVYLSNTFLHVYNPLDWFHVLYSFITNILFFVLNCLSNCKITGNMMFPYIAELNVFESYSEVMCF